MVSGRPGGYRKILLLIPKQVRRYISVGQCLFHLNDKDVQAFQNQLHGHNLTANGSAEKLRHRLVQSYEDGY